MAAERYRAVVVDKDDASPQQPAINMPSPLMAYRVHALCTWRDQVARRRDVGVQRVLPDEQLLQVARTGDADALSKDVARLIHSPPVWEAWEHQHRDALVKRLTHPMHHSPGDAAMLAKLEKQAQRFESLVNRFRAKGPVYDNCRMLSMDGRLLCYCDRRKLEW